MSEVAQTVLSFWCVKCKERHPYRLDCRVWQDMKALMRQHVDIDEDIWRRERESGKQNIMVGYGSLTATTTEN